MGRVRTTFVKTTSEKIYAKYKDKFDRSFDNNKKSVDEAAIINSKKLRNVIAGYITRMVEQHKKEK